MIKWLMQLLGFGDNDYEDDYDDYPDEPQRPIKKTNRPGRRNDSYADGGSPTRLVLFKGLPSEASKLKLRDLLLQGVMILIDLHGLTQREFNEEGRPFIDFMGGVAFAHKGRMEFIEPAQYLVTPHSGMFVVWDEEETSDDGSFDRQGR